MRPAFERFNIEFDRIYKSAPVTGSRPTRAMISLKNTTNRYEQELEIMKIISHIIVLSSCIAVAYSSMVMATGCAESGEGQDPSEDSTEIQFHDGDSAQSQGITNMLRLADVDAAPGPTTHANVANMLNCMTVVTSTLDVLNFAGTAVTMNYAVVGGGGGGGGSGIAGGGGGSSVVLSDGTVVAFSAGGAGSTSTGVSASPVTGSFLLPSGADLRVFVGGGGGGGMNWNGNFC